MCPRQIFQWLVPPRKTRKPSMAYIYALRDHITGKICYIGKTIDNPHKRLVNHLSGVRSSRKFRDKSRKGDWIRGLLEQGQTPDIIILGRVPYSEWRQWEKRCIRWFQEAGCDLVNGDAGGGGS